MAVDDFEEFYVDAEPRLRRALVAALGPVRGHDAASEALAYAWEHWDRVRSMQFPLGYLFRVGQSRTRERNARVVFPSPAGAEMPWIEPGLGDALSSLSEHRARRGRARARVRVDASRDRRAAVDVAVDGAEPRRARRGEAARVVGGGDA